MAEITDKTKAWTGKQPKPGHDHEMGLASSIRTKFSVVTPGYPPCPGSKVGQFSAG
jgi:hypothetical protein